MFTQRVNRKKRIIFYQQKLKIVTFAPSNLSVAQLVEQLTLNQWVRGSSPRGETKKKSIHESVWTFFIQGMQTCLSLQEWKKETGEQSEQGLFLLQRHISVW